MIKIWLISLIFFYSINILKADHTETYSYELEPMDNVLVFCKRGGGKEYRVSLIRHESLKKDLAKGTPNAQCNYVISERHHEPLFRTAKSVFNAKPAPAGSGMGSLVFFKDLKFLFKGYDKNFKFNHSEFSIKDQLSQYNSLYPTKQFVSNETVKKTTKDKKQTKVAKVQTQIEENLLKLSKSKIRKKAKKHSNKIVCIKKPYNNILKVEYTKDCNNGFQLKKKNLKDFWKFKDSNEYLDGYVTFLGTLNGNYTYYTEYPISYRLTAFTRNFDLLTKITNNFETYRNFETLKNKSVNFQILSAEEIKNRNLKYQKKIFICRKLTDSKKINFKSWGSYDYQKEGLYVGSVADIYATNGECESGFKSYVLQKGHEYYDIYYIEKKNFINRTNNFSNNIINFKRDEKIEFGYYFYIFIDILSDVKTDIAKQEKITPEEEKTEEEKELISELNQELAEENKLTNKPKITIKNKDVTDWEKKVLKAELYEKQNPSNCKETKTLVSKSYCIKKSDFLKLGEYKEIKNFPVGFLDSIVGCNSFSCINQNAGKKVYRIFVQRGEQYHARYPGAIIQGMVWFEILYFKRLKSSRFLDEFTYHNFEQPISGRKGKALLSLINMNNGRIKMRQALGYSLYDDTEDVIAAQWLLGEFMNKDKLKSVKNKSFTSDFKKRKELMAKYKDALARFNKKLKEKRNEAKN